ncbi:MAG: hypothetical protein WC775_04830 [Patescibacteria group bacterium]|jgi:hypothetical protein
MKNYEMNVTQIVVAALLAVSFVVSVFMWSFTTFWNSKKTRMLREIELQIMGQQAKNSAVDGCVKNTINTERTEVSWGLYNLCMKDKGYMPGVK